MGVESIAMNRSRLTAQRLVALVLLGCLLFNFPLLVAERGHLQFYLLFAQ